MNLRWILFSFEGRLGRLAYWLTAAAFAILVPFGGFALLALALTVPILAGLVAVALYIPLLWIGLAVGSKRLHDRDRSAGWLLAFYLLPSLLSQIAARLSNSPSGEIGSFVVTLASIGLAFWGLVEMGFLRGTIGENRFGPDPRDIPGPPTTGLIDDESHGNEEHALY